MKCPYCGHLGDKVVDSRESKEGEVIRRRRECLDCSRRFTSYERIDEIPYMVVKKDGSRERFERQSIGLTSLLSQAVILLILGDVMPKSAEQFPLIGAHVHSCARAPTLPGRAGSFVLSQCAITFVASVAAAVVMCVHTSITSASCCHCQLLRKIDEALLVAFLVTSALTVLPLAAAAAAE